MPIARGTGALIKLGGVERGAGLEPLGADLGEEAEVLGELFGAVTERRKVEFNYRGHERPVEPYGLAHRRGHWYLVGKSPEGERMYRVDRITDLRVGAEPAAFHKPKGFDMRETVASQPWEAGPDPETKTEVRFDPEVAWWAARSLGIPEPKGELTTTVRVTNRDAFIGWLLSFGASAEVVSTDDMRAAVAERVEEAMAQLP